MCFRPTGGVSGIHMSEDYLDWREYRVETLQNERECLGLPMCLRHVCVCLNVCTQPVSEGYKWLGIVLLAVPWFY